MLIPEEDQYTRIKVMTKCNRYGAKIDGTFPLDYSFTKNMPLGTVRSMERETAVLGKSPISFYSLWDFSLATISVSAHFKLATSEYRKMAEIIGILYLLKL